MEEIPTFKFAIQDGLGEEYLPTRAEPTATGWDVRAAERIELNPFDKAKISLGIRCFAPPGYSLELRPRSSTFAKKNLSALYGVIDNGYENYLLFACQWIPEMEKLNNRNYPKVLLIEKGDRIGQLVPVKLQEMNVEKVSADEFDLLCKNRGGVRGTGGFGSTLT